MTTYLLYILGILLYLYAGASVAFMLISIPDEGKKPSGCQVLILCVLLAPLWPLIILGFPLLAVIAAVAMSAVEAARHENTRSNDRGLGGG